MTTIEAYRSTHRIRATGGHRHGRAVWVCETDGIRIYAIRGGWRHDLAEVRAASRG